MEELEIREVGTSSKSTDEIRQESLKRRKRKRTTSWIRLIILILAISGMSYSGYNLYRIFVGYYEGQQQYKELSKFVQNTQVSNEQKAKNDLPEGKVEVAQPLLNIDFEGLQKINPEVVGWIDIPGLGISYPLVKGPDNEKYLNYTVSNQDNRSGSIFMDFRNSSFFEDTNTFLHGHNMRDGSMFAKLMEYMKSETLDKAPSIWIYTPDLVYKYDIFTAHVVDASSEAYSFSFDDKQVYDQYLKNMCVNSTINANIVPTQDDKIISLSTCTNVSDDERYLVQAVKSKTYTIEEAATKTVAD